MKKNELALSRLDRDGYGIVSTVVDRLMVRDLIERLNGRDAAVGAEREFRHLMKDPSRGADKPQEEESDWDCTRNCRV